jgi:hypothetical protein
MIHHTARNIEQNECTVVGHETPTVRIPILLIIIIIEGCGCGAPHGTHLGVRDNSIQALVPVVGATGPKRFILYFMLFVVLLRRLRLLRRFFALLTIGGAVVATSSPTTPPAQDCGWNGSVRQGTLGNLMFLETNNIGVVSTKIRLRRCFKTSNIPTQY